MGASNHRMLPSYNTHFHKIYKLAALWAEAYMMLHFQHHMTVACYMEFCFYSNLIPYYDLENPDLWTQKIDHCHILFGYPQSLELLQKCMN